jgi:hypothetical protein
MRALSIRQPSAEAIMRGIKEIEYRSQPTAIRERIYIYASLARDDSENQMLHQYGIKDVALDDLPRGVLIGTVELYGCYPGEDGYYEWYLRKPERLKTPLKPVHRANPVWFHPFGDDDAPAEKSKGTVKTKKARNA